MKICSVVNSNMLIFIDTNQNKVYNLVILGFVVEGVKRLEKPVANDRRNKIIRYVVENGSAKINELAKKFNVSMETIRKDLVYLEERRILSKGHGAVSAASSYLENSFALKEGENLDEKVRVAEIAATIVPENGVILLDSEVPLISWPNY